MTHRAISPSLLLAIGLTLTGCGGSDAGNESTDAARTPAVTADVDVVLDGTTKSLVVVGYSTSYAWPRMLQEMLDEHTDGLRTVHVLNAVIGGSPVGRWIAGPTSEDYQATYGAMVTDFFGGAARLRGDAPPPTVAIVQQSLQRTPTPETRLGPVTSVDDARGIRIGADALQTLVDQLRADGVEQAFIGMHIYKEGFEPEVGNERFALESLLARGQNFIHRGPDVWSLTIREHPAAFTDDRLHPNERGAKIMAEAWYRAIAGNEAQEAVIEAMHGRDYDVDAMMDDYLTWRAGGGSD